MPTQLTDELTKIVSEKLSGIMFVTSDDNKSAQMYIQNGIVVYAQCQGKKGKDAIDLMSKMNGIRFKFQKGPVPSSKIDMPSFDKIVSKIGKVSTKSNVSVKYHDKKEMLDAAASVNKSTLSDEKIALVREILTECIGPMALFVVEDNIGSAKTINELVDVLANELPSKQAKIFRENVEKKL